MNIAVFDMGNLASCGIAPGTREGVRKATAGQVVNMDSIVYRPGRTSNWSSIWYTRESHPVRSNKEREINL
jgi:hypothetical protein